MNKVKFTVLAIVAAAFATTASATDIEFHGYTRAGVGLAATGGTGMCFQLAGSDRKLRLGNECDYVIEPNFEITMAKLDDKSSWGFHMMPKVYKRWAPMDNGIGSAGGLDQLTLWMGQVYFYGNNVPWLGNGSIWAGRKYWERLQTGINDQFLENEDSEGFGLENADLGFGKLSVGFGMNNGSNFTDEQDAKSRLYRIAAHISGIQTLNKDSSLQIWAAYYGQSRNTKVTTGADASTPPDKVDAGYRIAAYHTFGMGAYGNLLIGGKYFKNNAIAGSDGDNTNNKVSGWRAIAQYGGNFPSFRTALDVIAEYRSKKADGSGQKNNTWFEAGFRTDTQISGPFRFLLEAGYDTTKSSFLNYKQVNMWNVTPALAISGGNDPWSRPTFRLYYHYANWSDVGANQAWLNGNSWVAGGNTSQAIYGDTAKSGASFGVQAEGWW